MKNNERLSNQENIELYTPIITSYSDRTIKLNYSVRIAYRVGEYLLYLLSDEVSIVGEYFEDTTKSISNGTSTISNTIKLPNNELESAYNVYSDGLVGSIFFTNYKLQKVTDYYSQGKEVYTLRCSLSNYNDLDGNVQISLGDRNYPMAFEKYQIVEPYTYTSRGEVPLSSNTDGTPKQFEIIGVDFSYSGVVWQEITIQEYKS